MSKNYIDTDVQMSFQKILATGYIPAPRNNHVSSFIQSRGLAFIHGGYDKKSEYNDAYTFNLKEKKWEKVKIQLKNPDSLRFVGHQSLHFPFDHCNNNVMMFGGWDGSKYTNQIIVINIQTNQVRQSNYSENVQSLDIGHQKNTKSTLEGKLFMQQDSPQKKQNVDNDLGLSNADQHEIQIKKLQQPNQLCPPGVRDHTLVYDYTKNQVVLFGGWDSFKFQFGCNEYNFLWTLDSKWNWHKVKTFGDIPSGRRGHTCIFLQNPYSLIIFGGIHGYNKLVNDSYQLDLKTFFWRKIFQKENQFYPQSRAFHTVNKIKSKLVYIGGMLKNQQITNQIVIYDYQQDFWTELEQVSQQIPPFMFHTSINTQENEIYLFGGTTIDEENGKQKNQKLNEIYKLKFEFDNEDDDVYLFQQNSFQSPKRYQKEEQLHWNMMAFPNLEQVSQDKQENQQTEYSQQNQKSKVSKFYQFKDQNSSDNCQQDEKKFDDSDDFAQNIRNKHNQFNNKVLFEVIEEKKKNNIKQQQNEGKKLNEEEYEEEDDDSCESKRKDNNDDDFNYFKEQGLNEYENE